MIRCCIKSFLKLIFLIILGLNCSFLFSQGTVISDSGCTGKLAVADDLFERGFYENCIASVEKILSDCDLSRKEREHALELMTKAYSEIPDDVQATRYVEMLLNSYPHYELNENENFESYNRLVKKYKIHPALSVGARNVIIWVGYNASKLFNFPEGVVSSEPYSGGNYFFSYYGWAEYEFDNNISINGDLMWWTSYYSKSFFVEPNLDCFYSENPVFVEIPIYAKKYFPIGTGLKPYVAAGMGWLYMTEASGYASKYNRDEKMNYWNDDIDVLSMRNRHNFEWVAGAGLGYKIRNVRLFFDIRYYRGITSITDPAHRDENELLRDEYHYVDQPLKMNKFETGVSIAYTFINSVKRIR